MKSFFIRFSFLAYFLVGGSMACAAEGDVKPMGLLPNQSAAIDYLMEAEGFDRDIASKQEQIKILESYRRDFPAQGPEITKTISGLQGDIKDLTARRNSAYAGIRNLVGDSIPHVSGAQGYQDYLASRGKSVASAPPPPDMRLYNLRNASRRASYTNPASPSPEGVFPVGEQLTGGIGGNAGIGNAQGTRYLLGLDSSLSGPETAKVPMGKLTLAETQEYMNLDHAERHNWASLDPMADNARLLELEAKMKGIVPGEAALGDLFARLENPNISPAERATLNRQIADYWQAKANDIRPKSIAPITPQQLEQLQIKMGNTMEQAIRNPATRPTSIVPRDVFPQKPLTLDVAPKPRYRLTVQGQNLVGQTKAMARASFWTMGVQMALDFGKAIGIIPDKLTAPPRAASIIQEEINGVKGAISWYENNKSNTLDISSSAIEAQKERLKVLQKEFEEAEASEAEFSRTNMPDLRNGYGGYSPIQ